MAVQLDREELHRLARLGAEARLVALEAERAQILGSFPELGSNKRSSAAAASQGLTAAAPARRSRRQMSAAERKAVSIRMKKSWAGRRKQAQS